MFYPKNLDIYLLSLASVNFICNLVIPQKKQYLQEGVQQGHGGIDFLELRALVECIKRKIDPPIDVYDGATWMAISPLSEASVAMGSIPVEFPDFTNGKWMTNKPIFGLTGEY